MPSLKNTDDLSIRPMVVADLKTVAPWLSAPRVKCWFEDDEYLETLREHLSDNAIDQWLVMLGETPIAYLQDYRIHAWDDHPLGALPEGSRGLDTFLGAEDLMGRGLGPAYLKLHCEHLFATGAPALGIDPHPENLAAIRAYEKVGFQGDKVTDSPWGRIRLMMLWPKSGIS